MGESEDCGCEEYNGWCEEPITDVNGCVYVGDVELSFAYDAKTRCLHINPHVFPEELSDKLVKGLYNKAPFGSIDVALDVPGLGKQTYNVEQIFFRDP